MASAEVRLQRPEMTVWRMERCLCIWMGRRLRLISDQIHSAQMPEAERVRLELLVDSIRCDLRMPIEQKRDELEKMGLCI